MFGDINKIKTQLLTIEWDIKDLNRYTGNSGTDIHSLSTRINVLSRKIHVLNDTLLILFDYLDIEIVEQPDKVLAKKKHEKD